MNRIACLSVITLCVFVCTVSALPTNTVAGRLAQRTKTARGDSIVDSIVDADSSVFGADDLPLSGVESTADTFKPNASDRKCWTLNWPSGVDWSIGYPKTFQSAADPLSIATDPQSHLIRVATDVAGGAGYRLNCPVLPGEQPADLPGELQRSFVRDFINDPASLPVINSEFPVAAWLQQSYQQRIQKPRRYRLAVYKLKNENDIYDTATVYPGVWVYLDSNVLNAVTPVSGLVDPAKCSTTATKFTPFFVLGVVNGQLKLKSNRGKTFGLEGSFLLPAKQNACGINRNGSGYAARFEPIA